MSPFTTPRFFLLRDNLSKFIESGVISLFFIGFSLLCPLSGVNIKISVFVATSLLAVFCCQSDLGCPDIKVFKLYILIIDIPQFYYDMP